MYQLSRISFRSDPEWVSHPLFRVTSNVENGISTRWVDLWTWQILILQQNFTLVGNQLFKTPKIWIKLVNKIIIKNRCMCLVNMKILMFFLSWLTFDGPLRIAHSANRVWWTAVECASDNCTWAPSDKSPGMQAIGRSRSAGDSHGTPVRSTTYLKKWQRKCIVIKTKLQFDRKPIYHQLSSQETGNRRTATHPWSISPRRLGYSSGCWPYHMNTSICCSALDSNWK